MAPQEKRVFGESSRAPEPALVHLQELRKCIPQECFVKSLPSSVAYLLLDYSLWSGLLWAVSSLRRSVLWPSLPTWLQWLVSLFYWNAAGFVMWAVFVIGHDCGHGTFSDYDWLNDLVGHLTHGSVLVPFYSWQLSHRRHHMHHNHADKDYSHPWFTKERLRRPEEGQARFQDRNPLLRLAFPLVGWPIYLLGLPDGCHLLPIPFQRLWRNTPTVEYYKCLVSSAVVLGFLWLALRTLGDLRSLWYYFLVPWLVMGWWLVTVTYLQHHDHDTVVFDNRDWQFVLAAFQSIDRKFGYGIDAMHHHITDCHVVHHLFFTKIPHYSLPRATEAMKRYLAKTDLLYLYKSRDTPDFATRIFRQYFETGLRAKRQSAIAR